jgi:GT2 family glycosyltransferase
MMIDNIEILSVNYNTPDFIDRLIKSVRENEGGYQIRIIDGSDREPFKTEILVVCEKYANVVLQQQGWNIHHGRGMDLGVTTSSYEWCLIIDSDNFIKQPIIERMFKATEIGKKIIGSSCYIYPGYKRVRYYHPSFLLFNTSYYKELKNMGVMFVHHGAPCAEIMYYLHDNNLSDIVGADVFEYLNIPKSAIADYINTDNQGTANRFGYNYE